MKKKLTQRKILLVIFWCNLLATSSWEILSFGFHQTHQFQFHYKNFLISFIRDTERVRKKEVYYIDSETSPSLAGSVGVLIASDVTLGIESINTIYLYITRLASNRYLKFFSCCQVYLSMIFQSRYVFNDSQLSNDKTIYLRH